MICAAATVTPTQSKSVAITRTNWKVYYDYSGNLNAQQVTYFQNSEEETDTEQGAEWYQD